jgi:hypothetical protein
MRKSFGGIALLLLVAACAHAPQRETQPIDYMGALRDAEALVAASNNASADESAALQGVGRRSAALQQLAVSLSWVGDEAGAARAFDKGINLEPLDLAQRHAGEQDARAALEAYAPEAAVEAIAREARNRQIVILNEAHHVARHRAFALRVAIALRKLGFQYLAMETLAPDTTATMRRGYPVGGTGNYTREPFFGDYVRRALAQGYTLVAYEQDSPNQSVAPDMFASIEAREDAQARNLVQRIFREHPDARVLIHVGQQHVMKGEWQVGDRRITWMAERLRRLTGIDPLCIDQANAGQQPRQVIRGLEDLAGDPTEPAEIVLRDRQSATRYWPGSESVDMQVIHVGNADVLGRPLWIGWTGERHRRAVPTKLLPREGRRLIQAFIAGESADAVPVDQVLAYAGKPAPMLMLPEARIRFAIQE